jgi:hypothetical protein
VREREERERERREKAEKERMNAEVRRKEKDQKNAYGGGRGLKGGARVRFGGVSHRQFVIGNGGSRGSRIQPVPQSGELLQDPLHGQLHALRTVANHDLRIADTDETRVFKNRSRIRRAQKLLLSKEQKSRRRKKKKKIVKKVVLLETKIGG